MKCARCQSQAVEGASLCPVHMVRARVFAWSQQRPRCNCYLPRSGVKGRNSVDPLRVIAEKLLKQLAIQNNKCAISGKLIQLGVNAEIDHIEPIAINPAKAFEIDNMRWVDSTINKTNTKGTPKKTNASNEQKLLKALVDVQHKAANWKITDQRLMPIWESINELINAYNAIESDAPFIADD
jgi:hypothetical protein